jgi:hypothetical protein
MLLVCSGGPLLLQLRQQLCQLRSLVGHSRMHQKQAQARLGLVQV